MFLLCDAQNGAALGTSMIVAQLGRRDAPYIYLDVIDEEKYSSALDRHFKHTVLRIGFSYDGPTEIGGLVVAPEYRRGTSGSGLLISYVRFLYIAMHRELFRDEILAELLPPLEPDGTSHLWEALGRRFTGMSYAEADLLSSENKEFIRDLFPSGSDLRDAAQPRGAERDRQGRRADARRREDAAPHRLSLRRAHRSVRRRAALRRRRRRDHAAQDTRAPAPGSGEPAPGKLRALVGRDLSGPPYFRAVASDVELAGTTVRLPGDVSAQLSVGEGDELFCLPLKQTLAWLAGAGAGCGRAFPTSSSSTRPSRMCTTRGMRSAKAGLCVTTTIVVPCLRLIWKKSSWIASLVAVSRLPVGSSASRSFGSRASARASATRCCSPPESSPGRCVTRSREADLVEQGARALLHLALRRGPGSARASSRSRAR